jgi:hypothetical protein
MTAQPVRIAVTGDRPTEVLALILGHIGKNWTSTSRYYFKLEEITPERLAWKGYVQKTRSMRRISIDAPRQLVSIVPIEIFSGDESDAHIVINVLSDPAKRFSIKSISGQQVFTLGQSSALTPKVLQRLTGEFLSMITKVSSHDPSPALLP